MRRSNIVNSVFKHLTVNLRLHEWIFTLFAKKDVGFTWCQDTYKPAQKRRKVGDTNTTGVTAKSRDLITISSHCMSEYNTSHILLRITKHGYSLFIIGSYSLIGSLDSVTLGRNQILTGDGSALQTVLCTVV